MLNKPFEVLYAITARFDKNDNSRVGLHCASAGFYSAKRLGITVSMPAVGAKAQVKVSE